MKDTARGRRRSPILGLALLLASLAAVVGSAQLVDAAQPRPVTQVSGAETDPSDPLGLCRITRACWG